MLGRACEALVNGIAHESGGAETIDPLGGSWCVEALTSGIERQAWEYIDRIDRMGGVIPAVDSGYIQKEIQDPAYRYQLQVERKEQVVVGVNDFVVQEGKPDNILKADPRVEKDQRKRLAALRKRRDGAAVRAALGKIESAYRGKANVMGPILSAVRAYATLGEISDVMQSVFGTHRGKATV
jgi:methylmalonyl-CoA mutase N-terminal domain/subunit